MSIEILGSVDSSQIQELKAEILSKRSLGNILFEIKQINSDITLNKADELTEILDLFVTQMGYVGIGDRWQEIHQDAAQKIVVFVLKKDLAYSAKIMPTEEAEKISTKILNLFANPCRFFTNAVFVNDYSALSAWDSLTNSTFDTGILVVNSTMMGMLWVKDED
ncbi:hypothetical protein NIES2107_66790 [Nostoc carneum NIES-2107]|nr:hypothetical protein NIES2107_66790 [Nostoc carneum NIES-2107]